jgi:2-amino-4-hydroxy-6-hydroxymethyldihydropteridine diphosphokinase
MAELLCIGLGANLGDRVAVLNAALQACTARLGSPVAVSSWWETAAWGMPEGTPPFLNGAAAFALPSLSPEAVLDTLLAIEQHHGRVRGIDPGYVSRTLDLDILLFGTAQLATSRLAVPHPRMAARRFVLAPLAEVAPYATVPATGCTVAELLAACTDEAEVARLHPAWP